MNSINVEHYPFRHNKFPEQFSNSKTPNKYLWLKDPFAQLQDKPSKTSAAGLIIAAASLMMLSKGVQKNSKIILVKLKKYIDKKFDKSFLDDKPKKKIHAFTARKIDSFIRKSESLNNIISLKDILFMKLMYKTGFTRWVHSSVSKLFENISMHSVTKSYKKTQKQFDKMYEVFDKFDEYLLKNPANKTYIFKDKEYTFNQMIEKAKSCRENIKLVVSSFIAQPTQQAHYDIIKGSTSSLYSNFWDVSFKGFWTKENKFKRKEMWQTFIAAEQIKSNKTDLAKNVAFARNMLSYTQAEKSGYISGYLKNIDSMIPAKDIEGVNILKRLNWYIQDSSALTSNKENFMEELEKLDKYSKTLSSDSDISKNRLKDIDTNISMIRNMINDEDKGELGDMLNIYRQLAPFELSKSGALDIAQKSVESFDKSVKLETDVLFDKLRDLDLGSAPTDVLTLIFSSLMISLGLSKAKNSDERKSVILKSGIPIIGAVATTTISATKLIPNGRSLMLGFISGIILNRIGVVADNFRKSLKTSKTP